MKVLVSGGSGFLGSFVADSLSEAGHEVTIFDLKPSPYLKNNQKMIVGNMMDKGKVDDAVNGMNAVYHFAGVSDIATASNQAYEALQVNLLGTLNFLEASRLHKISRFVFASTLYVYSRTGSFYRASKQSCELMIEAFFERFGLPYTVLRYGSLYGPRAGQNNWIQKILRQAFDEKKMVREGDGEEIRDYIHVTDAARLSVKVLDKQYENQCVIISGNQSIKIKDLMTMIKEMLNHNVEIEFSNRVGDAHYEITPYNFKPRLAKRIEDTSYIDLGQGILDLIYAMAEQMAPVEPQINKPRR